MELNLFVNGEKVTIHKRGSLMKLSSFVDALPISLGNISTYDKVDVSNFAKFRYECDDYGTICSIKRFWFICELGRTIINIRYTVINSKNDRRKVSIKRVDR